jgi:hypothetical protein
MHAPSSTHWIAAKRVLRYLQGTLDHGLYYTKSNLQVNAFCDSDWAGCLDDRRSTTGFAVFLGDCLIAWSAKKQVVVSRSSTEAEYRSLSVTAVELFWIRMLFKELRIYLATPPVLWCDNVSALALASNPVFHARTKHIEVDYHFVREKVLNRDILLKFISTHDQVVDLFTKGLPSAQFLALKSKLLVVPTPINLRGCVKGYQASRRRDVRSITDRAPGSIAPSVANEERRRDVRSIANHMQSIAYACKAHSRSCRKAETQYGKIHYVPQPPLSACKVTLAVCRRKETQPLAALDNKQKISLSLM